VFTQQGAISSVLLAKYYSGDKIEENEMRKINGTCGGQERCMQGFGGEI